MKKLILLFISLLAFGAIFQACDDTKTYAEMLDEERDAVNSFISNRNINVISVEDFEQDTITDVSKDEYVGFPNGVYMQIVKRYGKPRASTEPYKSLQDAPVFANNNLILTRFLELDILQNDTTIASNVENPIAALNLYPDGFRYTDTGTSIYGLFVQEPGLSSQYYLSYRMSGMYGTSVPAGWLMALQYVRDGAHVKLIIPSKSGHTIAQQKVYPYFYDIRELSIY